ncbi:MAG: hypothetical protein Q8R02_17460 [Hyphomonadaceae bacterium]|nr:hypothetical protein [Hyphomonadaceae bacterium]
MLTVIWKYRVAAQSKAAFEAAYGPEGPWVELFSESPDYDGTELLRSEDGVYLTIDRWISADAYDNFVTLHRADYADIDEECEPLTESEELVGRFLA